MSHLFHRFFQRRKGPETSRLVDQFTEETDEEKIKREDQKQQPPGGQHEIDIPLLEQSGYRPEKNQSPQRHRHQPADREKNHWFRAEREEGFYDEKIDDHLVYP